MTNLKPFTGVDDTRRQNGRKLGSKNISTLVRDILDSEISSRLPLNNEIKQFIEANDEIRSYAKAMSLAMVVKAINGDVRAANWVTDQYDKSPESEGFFERTSLVFNVISPNKHENELEEQ